MRTRPFLIAALLFATCALGCKSSRSSGDANGSSGSRAKKTDVDCSEIPVPSDPLLAGAPRSAREAIRRRAESGLVVVEYVAEGCDVRLRVLSDCSASGAYTYRSAGKREQHIIKGERTLLEMLPLADGSMGDALKEKGALRLDQLRVGRLEAARIASESGSGGGGDGLEGKDCRRATHVAVAIDLGGSAVTAGAKDALDREAGFFDHEAGGGVEVVERAGDAKACASAAKKGELTSGCDLPLRLDLQPVAQPSDAASKLAARMAHKDGPRKEPRKEPRKDRGGGGIVAESGMIAVPAGEFVMGNDAEKTEAPRHKVLLDAFSIDRLEVSVAEYEACVKDGACTATKKGLGCNSGNSERARHPINCVNYSQAKAYCAHAGGRLPTEAEWERAARGTDGRPFVWGSEWPPRGAVANLADAAARKAHPFWLAVEGYEDGFAETSPVGAFPEGASPVGALDMAGNVMEWTADYYSDRAYTKGQVKNPKGPSGGEGRVVRGGSFGQHRPGLVSATARAGYREDVVSEHIGFRCAK